MNINWFEELCNDDTPNILWDLPQLRDNLLARFQIFDRILQDEKIKFFKNIPEFNSLLKNYLLKQLQSVHL